MCLKASPHHTVRLRTAAQAVLVDMPDPLADEPALLEALKKQVEFYFSKENLANDTYLVSQMNSQHYVPISTILEVRCLNRRVVVCVGGWWLSVVALHGRSGVWRDAA